MFMSTEQEKRIEEIRARLGAANIDFSRSKTAVMKALEQDENLQFAFCCRTDLYFLLNLIENLQQEVDDKYIRRLMYDDPSA